MYVPESHEHEMLRQGLRRFLDRECPREKVRRWDEFEKLSGATTR